MKKKRDPVLLVLCGLLFLVTVHLGSQPIAFLQRAFITLLADLIILGVLISSNFGTFQTREEEKAEKK